MRLSATLVVATIAAGTLASAAVLPIVPDKRSFEGTQAADFNRQIAKRGVLADALTGKMLSTLDDSLKSSMAPTGRPSALGDALTSKMMGSLDDSLKQTSPGPRGRPTALGDALTSKALATLDESLKPKSPPVRSTPLHDALTKKMMATLDGSLKYKPSGGHYTGLGDIISSKLVDTLEESLKAKPASGKLPAQSSTNKGKLPEAPLQNVNSGSKQSTSIRSSSKGKENIQKSQPVSPANPLPQRTVFAAQDPNVGTSSSRAARTSRPLKQRMAANNAKKPPLW